LRSGLVETHPTRCKKTGRRGDTKMEA